jgi:hypothetical protein
MMPHFDNEDASAGSLIGSIVCIGIVSTVFWVIGKAVDQTIGITNTMISYGGISQDAANTIFLLACVLASLPFIYMLAVIVNYWSTAADESSGGV